MSTIGSPPHAGTLPTADAPVAQAGRAVGMERFLKAWVETVNDYLQRQYRETHSKVSKDVIHRSVKRYHERWVRTNLPPGFPKHFGLQ